ncbi:MAG TPA: hypothetical protein VHF25_15210 [Nitriliruptorales bacterium]|nr:hypothetical protein [Nitriliruptorales bacterium]
METTERLSVRVRAYLGSFLTAAEVDAAVVEVATDLDPGDGTQLATFAAAHKALTRRVRVASDAAAEALVHEAGLDVEQAAGILDLDPAVVRDAVARGENLAQELAAPTVELDHQVLVFDDVSASEPLPAEPGTATSGRGGVLTLAVTAVVVLAVLAALVLAR